MKQRVNKDEEGRERVRNLFVAADRSSKVNPAVRPTLPLGQCALARWPAQKWHFFTILMPAPRNNDYEVSVLSVKELARLIKEVAHE